MVIATVVETPLNLSENPRKLVGNSVLQCGKQMEELPHYYFPVFDIQRTVHRGIFL